MAAETSDAAGAQGRVEEERISQSGGLLKRRSFAPLFWVQALGAFNDNVFKTAFVSLMTYVLASRENLNLDVLVPAAAAIFIIPFALFAPFAGQIADQPIARGRAIGRVAEPLVEQLAGPLQRRLDVFHPAILQRHAEAAKRAPGRDVATHDPGAHDVHVSHRRRRRPRMGQPDPQLRLLRQPRQRPPHQPRSRQPPVRPRRRPPRLHRRRTPTQGQSPHGGGVMKA